MNYPPACPTCGESVADYKGPCPKEPPMTLTHLTAEELAEIDRAPNQGCAHEYAKTHANPFLIRNPDGSLNKLVNLARAYLELSDLRLASQRAAAAGEE